jgi:hypothetical protein
MDKEHPDIKFLKKRLNYVVALEQYEIAAVIKKWIDELIELYNKN